MKTPMARSKWTSTSYQLRLHGECEGLVRWVNERTVNICPCKCHKLNPGVSGEGDT